MNKQKIKATTINTKANNELRIDFLLKTFLTKAITKKGNEAIIKVVEKMLKAMADVSLTI